ncbi:MAG: response regulator transcription factor [Thiohalocapsa sp.]|nr:response regulator transcription factor [Thiohalocapsa sp.]
MTVGARIIIVEDNVAYARSNARWLARDGYESALAPSVAEFRRLYRNEDVDLVLLDLNLGMDDGMDLARELASTTTLGLIIMTGRGEVEDRVRGLDAGADDYLVKPFSMNELSARVRAVMRRKQPLSGETGIGMGPLQLDIGAGVLHFDSGAAVALTDRQCYIMSALLKAGGKPVDRRELTKPAVWSPGDRSVDVHIGQIRRKLERAGIGYLMIAAVRGRGYRLTITSTPAARDGEARVVS